MIPPQTLWSPPAASWVVAAAWVEARWQAAVLIWSAGVVLLSLHLLRGWLLVKRIRRSGAEPAADWMPQMQRLASRLGIRRRLRLLESAWIEVPSVIGWIRPVILVPASALAGLPPAQFEAILAHELAHVRRHDYLVNILQSVIEVLLFYHPAVWWTSRRVRLEREHCCDDVAAEVCGDRVAYAAALTSLEERRGATPAFAIGAHDGDLLARVRRLVGVREISHRPLAGWVVLGIVGFVGVTLGARASEVTQPQPATGATAPAAALDAPTAVQSTTPHATPTSGVHTAVRSTSPAQQLQESAGTIGGAVIDAQGGRLPGVTVTITSADNSRTASSTTNVSGRYAFSGVPAGEYDVTMMLPGFRTATHRVRVGVGASTLNVRLDVGGVSETLTVAAPAPPGVAPSAPQPPTDLRDARALELLAEDLARKKSASDATLIADVVDTFPVRVGGDIKAPRKIHDVKPAYPPDALAAGVQGVVILEAVIATDGTVRDARVLRSIPALDDAALGAVRQWAFTPTLLNGVPVEVIMTVTVNFTVR
jgi:TonB family protein